MDDREEYLRAMLAHLEREFRQRADPLVRELAEIEAAKPKIFTLDLTQIEARVLAMMAPDDATVRILEQELERETNNGTY